MASRPWLRDIVNIGRARYPLAVIPIWWLLSASAVAEPGAPANEDISERSDEQSPPPPSDEDSTPLLATEVDGKGMLIVLSDPQDHFSGKPPSGWIANDDNRVSFVLSDDGKAPDAKAGDSIYTRLVADAPRGPNVEITLTEGDGKEMWRDRVPIGSEIPQPRADLRVDGSRVKANFTTFPKVEGATGLPYLQGEENEAFPFPQGGVLTAPSAGGPLSPSGRDNATQFMMGALLGLIGLAVGGGLGLAFGRQRRGPSDLRPVTDPKELPLGWGFPDIRKQQQVWILENASDLLESMVWLSNLLAGSCPILIAPGRAQHKILKSRLARSSCTTWLDRGNLSPDELVKAADQLTFVGRPLLIVGGVNALEEPMQDEGADVVVSELLEDLPDTVDVIVLLDKNDMSHLTPTLKLGWDGDDPTPMPWLPDDAVDAQLNDSAEE